MLTLLNKPVTLVVVRQNVVYGEELALNVPADASVLEFTPHLSDQHSVLWRRIHRGGDEEARGAVKDGRWTAQRMTQADQGRYTLLRESGGQISSTVVSVEGKSNEARAENMGQMIARIVKEDKVLPYFSVSK